MRKVIVQTEFADRDDFTKRYQEGDELVGFDEERIASLEALGVVKVIRDDDMPTNAGDLISLIAQATDVDVLDKYLDTENERDKPRKSVVKAIEERMAVLLSEGSDPEEQEQ